MPDPERPTKIGSRWLQIVVGLVVGAVLAAMAFGVVGLVWGEKADPVDTTYRLGDDDALGPAPVSLIVVSDIRQPSSIPGLAAPAGDRYVSLTLPLERRGATAQEWFTLEDLSLSLFAVDGAGERDELIPTETSRRLVEGIGGRVSGVDPYWILLEYEPPAGDVDECEIDLRVDGVQYSFTMRAEGAA